MKVIAPRAPGSVAGLIIGLLLAAASACAPVSEDDPSSAADGGVSAPGGAPGTSRGPAPARPPGWAEESHGRHPAPLYDRVFRAGEVGRLDVTIAPGDWKKMQDDLAAQLGRFGAGGLALPPAGSLKYLRRDPVYVEATVAFAGLTWRHVGFRFRGNYSLADTWRQGKRKLPFRLDFDEFEDAHPETHDQRFFGLKAVALMNNHGDPSQLREKVADELFRAAGVAAPFATYVRLFLDVGAGPVYHGLYTLTEVPGKPLLQARFGAAGGNLYKPDGEGAKLGRFVEDSFEKKTNEKAADFSDVKALIAALGASRRDPADWRAGLDRVFSTEAFLRWLAVNNVLENWDTYGVLAHNYYLYAHPGDGGRLHWVAWDHNNSWKGGFLLWGPRAMTLRDVGADWPAIRHVIDDPVYRERYRREVRAFLDGPGSPAAIEARLRADHALVAPFVVGAQGEASGYTLLDTPASFTKELDVIVDRVRRRAEEARRMLAAP